MDDGSQGRAMPDSVIGKLVEATRLALLSPRTRRRAVRDLIERIESGTLSGVELEIAKLDLQFARHGKAEDVPVEIDWEDPSTWPKGVHRSRGGAEPEVRDASRTSRAPAPEVEAGDWPDLLDGDVPELEAETPSTRKSRQVLDADDEAEKWANLRAAMGLDKRFEGPTRPERRRPRLRWETGETYEVDRNDPRHLGP